MSIGFFTDKGTCPTDAQIREAIGPRLPLWQDLIHALREGYPVQEDFKFLYGKTYGWGLRFRLKGQLLTSLYPTRGGFTAQVNLSPEAIEKILGMHPGPNVQRAIERAQPYPEGRWLFIPVESEADLGEVKQLVALRAETRRLVK